MNRETQTEKLAKEAQQLTQKEAEDIGDLGNELDEPDDLSETAREAERRLNADAWDE